MIKEITLANVRIFDGEGWHFPLAPLTIFCGTNSAGKSTVLKCILFLRQNFGRLFPGQTTPSGVLFDGKSVDVGDFQSLVSLKDLIKPVRIGVRIADYFDGKFRELLREFLSPEKLQAIEPFITSKQIHYELTSEFVLVNASVLGRTPSNENAEGDSGVLQSCRHELFIGGESILRWDITYKKKASAPGDAFTGLPYEITMPVDFLEAALGNILEPEQINEKGYGVFTVLVNGLLPMVMRGIAVSRTKKSKRKSEVEVTYVPLPPILNNVMADLNRNFQRVEYLGPLRSPGKRYYILTKEKKSDLDTAGEFLPYILRDRKHTEIFYCSPENPFKLKKGTLELALNEWLYYLKVGEPLPDKSHRIVHTEFQRQVLGELQIKGPGNKDYAIADTGFGYSQVLPVLVRGLLTPVNATFVVEQPELHLHPALQVRLAAFFIGMIYSNHFVILESHSEHIVNALRALTAENIESDLHSRIKVFYLEASDGAPRLHDLSVAKDGTLPAWPKSFFGEGLALSSRILRAQRKHLAAATRGQDE